MTTYVNIETPGGRMALPVDPDLPPHHSRRLSHLARILVDSWGHDVTWSVSTRALVLPGRHQPPPQGATT